MNPPAFPVVTPRFHPHSGSLIGIPLRCGALPLPAAVHGLTENALEVRRAQRRSDLPRIVVVTFRKGCCQIPRVHVPEQGNVPVSVLDATVVQRQRRRCVASVMNIHDQASRIGSFHLEWPLW